MPRLQSSWRSRFRTVLVWSLRALQILLPLEEARTVEAVVRRLHRPARRRAARLHATAPGPLSSGPRPLHAPMPYPPPRALAGPAAH